MPGLLNADASFSSKQELLDLEDYPMNEGPSLHAPSLLSSQIGSSDHRRHDITATGDTALPNNFTGNSPLPGHVCGMETRCHAENPMGLNLISTDSDQLCGWGALTPKAFQFFNTPRWVLFFLCMASFLQGMIVNGLINTVITSIERRFDLRSYQTGLIVSTYDIAGCLSLAYVSYFGGNGHKTQWLGFGVLIMGLGSLVFALPHFITPSYQVSLSEQPGMCSVNRTSLGQDKEDGGLSYYRFMFMLGQFLHGMGATPLYTLGVTYLDENVNSNHAPVYIGIYYTAAILGPAAGYMLGGYFLNIYTETNMMTVMTPEDPLWVGAWWIGFLAGGVAALLVAIPILGYPHQLPGSEKLAALRVSEAHQLGDESQTTASDPQFGKSVKDMPRSVLLLVKNPTFLFLCLAGATEATLIAGVSTFGPKYLESQFNLSASEAATWFGFMVVPAGGGGTFLGGFIVKKLNLRCRGIIRFCMMCAAVSLLANFIFLIHCPNVPMAGVTAPYQTGLMKEQVEQNEHPSSLEVNLTVACNAGCNCIREVYNPVCGADGMMYYSPCHAGCNAVNLTKDSTGKKVYIGCSCVVPNVSQGEEGFTLAGKCGTSCHHMPVFLLVFFIISSFTFLASIPALTATLRCVSHTQRSFGLGIQWIVMRAFGSIPGPIAFGSMIDISCLLWQDKHGDQGSCYVYQNSAMSRYTLGAGVIYKALGLIFFLLASILYQPPPESPQSSCENTDHGAYLPSKDISEDGVIVNQHAAL